MATRFPWMTGVDRAILDWLDSYDIVFTPTVIHENLRRELSEKESPSYSQIARRLRFLRDEAGLLKSWGEEQGRYVLSETGRRYLNNELSDEERSKLADLELDDLLEDDP